jgi:THO complex subunit 5
VKTLKDGIKSRRKFLDGLGAQLKGLKRASLPLQTHLELPIALAERRSRAARTLPPPLYVLYTQLAAAKEAFAEDIEVSIEGSIADAEAFARRESAAREKAAAEGGGGGGEPERVSDSVPVSGSNKMEDVDDEDGERKRKRARASTGAGEDGDDLYATHPLSVALVVDSGSAKFTFRHHVALRVVSCETHASLEADLLVHLFPDDDGEDTPNAANALRSRGFRWDADGRRRERPFRWCQHLAGVDFLPAAPPTTAAAAAVHEGVATHQRQARVRNVLAAIRARMTSRAKLKCVHRSERTANESNRPRTNRIAREPTISRPLP